MAVTTFMVGCSNPDEEPVAGHDKPGKNAKLPASAGADKPLPDIKLQSPVATAGTLKGFEGVQKIFAARCMPCHSGNKHSGGIDLSTYEAVMNDRVKGRPLVQPRQVMGSPLLGAIVGPAASMPKNMDHIAIEDVDAISTWIHDGAKKD